MNSPVPHPIHLNGDHLHRPPWTTETRVRAACTSCGACIRACPEGILLPGRAGTPVLQFDLGACIFCRKCADACLEPVFADGDQSPWFLVASIGPACLLTQDVSCQSCTDACDTGALRFDYRAGRVGGISVDTTACSGCGGCQNVCPAGAITLHAEAAEDAA